MRAYPRAGKKATLPPATTIKSPSFEVRPPSVRNLELIDPGARASMEVSWKRGIFPERDIEVFHIRGAFFREECLIFDDELQVIENASDPYTEEDVDRALANIRRLLEAEKLPHSVGPGVVSKRRAASNYGHFLMEMLPMAIAGRAGPNRRKPSFLLHRVQPKMLDVVLRSACGGFRAKAGPARMGGEEERKEAHLGHRQRSFSTPGTARA